MAETLSVDEYVKNFLLKPSDDQNNLKSPDGKEKSVAGRLLVATVYRNCKDGVDEVIYSRKVAGSKTSDPVAEFVKDMTGKSGPSGKRSTNVREIGGDSELKLPPNCSVNVEVLATQSPSNVGADELLRLLEYCKRNSIRASIHFTFAHPYSWDNKYNKEGMQSLAEKGVKLRPLGLQQGLTLAINDVQSNLETLDGLQTSRGEILIDHQMLGRATSKIREAISTKSDFYLQDNFERLHEIIGSQNRLQVNTDASQRDSTAFSLQTYRDYFLLQNPDEVWAKFKVNLAKSSDGVVQDEQLFEHLYNKSTANAVKHDSNGSRDVFGGKEQVKAFTDQLWRLIGDNITLRELTTQDEIVVSLNAVVSEYPDQHSWHAAIAALHCALADKLKGDHGSSKVRIETRIRYATRLHDADQSQAGSLGVSNGRSPGVTTECLHIQDILLDMLEDLEDRIKRMGTFDFGRGANLRIDNGILSSGMGLLHRSLRIRTEDGEEHSMSSDFIDAYAEGESS